MKQLIEFPETKCTGFISVAKRLKKIFRLGMMSLLW